MKMKAKCLNLDTSIFEEIEQKNLLKIKGGKGRLWEHLLEFVDFKCGNDKC